jgi:tetratricopeptide (TPR) repeat protein
MAQLPEEALKLIKDLQQNRDRFQISRTNVNELMFAEASAYLANKDSASAEIVIEKALKQYQTDKELLPKMLATASRMYMNFGVFSNALPLIDRQLTIAPDNIDALFFKGYAFLQLRLFEQAVPPFTRVLQSTNYAPALLNRAIAYLRSGQLEASQGDYEALLKTLPNAYPVYYGLGEIAYLRKDTNAAIRYYELYLTNGSPNPEETKFVSQRLAELKPR